MRDQQTIHRNDINKSYWYAVPPYDDKRDQWKILNECAELVATFEERDECLEAVNAFNKLKNNEL